MMTRRCWILTVLLIVIAGAIIIGVSVPLIAGKDANRKAVSDNAPANNNKNSPAPSKNKNAVFYQEPSATPSTAPIMRTGNSQNPSSTVPPVPSPGPSASVQPSSMRSLLPTMNSSSDYPSSEPSTTSTSTSLDPSTDPNMTSSPVPSPAGPSASEQPSTMKSLSPTAMNSSSDYPSSEPTAIRTAVPSLLLQTTNNSKNIKCHSTAIDNLPVVADPDVPDGYRLQMVVAHSRHLDRWMYRHDYIDNICWPNQLNSSTAIMRDQCRYNQSTIWQEFAFQYDPYAYPDVGNCNHKQLTVQGTNHSQLLGMAYRQLFSTSSSNSGEDDLKLCEEGTIRLESSEASQKNIRSLQDVYVGICHRHPDITEFPSETVMHDGGVSGPFFLRTAVCESEFLRNALAEAKAAFLASDYVPQLRETAAKVANITGKDEPIDGRIPTLLDNVWDCMVSNECHDLDDVPEPLWDIQEDIDILETASRLYAFEYFEQRQNEPGREGEYERFVANYYGYYFVTVLQRMQEAVDNCQNGNQTNNAVQPLLYVQVTSDSVVSPQLRILGAPLSVYKRRPVWGSGVVYQLLLRQNDRSFYVRALHEGQVLRMELLAEFADFVDKIKPSVEDCSNFYDNYFP